MSVEDPNCIDIIATTPGSREVRLIVSDHLSYSDPFGLCPGKAASGTVCVAFFIEARTTLGGVLAGDGRGATPFSAPSQSRAYYIWNPSGANESKVNKTCFGFGGCSGPLNTNRLSATADGNGGFTLEASLTNALVPGPSIDANLHFTRKADGDWQVSGTRDGYPSFEAYYYRPDGTVQTIVHQREGKPRQLWGTSDTKVQSP